MGFFDLSYAASVPGQNPMVRLDPKSMAIVQKAIAKAVRTTSATLLPKVAERDRHGEWSFK